MTKLRWDVRPYLRGLVVDALGISKPPRNPALPKGASIVVLPFDNISGDDDQDYLTDGVTEELTNALSRISRYVFVISAETAFSRKEADFDPARIGTELGVRYILRGTVERKEHRLGITAELLEARTGRTLWTEAFEPELAEMYTAQADIVERLLMAVGFELDTAEADRSPTKPPRSIRSVESLWRGYYHVRQLTHKHLLIARSLFRTAIEGDPELASAYGLLAGTFTQEHTQGWSLDPTLVDQAFELATRGVELDPNAGVCHGILGVVEISRGNWRKAVRHEDRAIELDPNVTWGHALRGIALAQGQKPLAASRSIRRALRLDPNPPHGLLLALSYINYGAGRKADSMALLEKVRRENADNILARVGLARYHQHEGDKDYARALVQQILEINPAMTIEIAMNLIPGLDKIHPKNEFMYYADDLAAAGLPHQTQKAGNPP